MIAIFSFYTPKVSKAKFDTNTQSVVESAKIVTEMCKMFYYTTGSKADVTLHREDQIDQIKEDLPLLSREFMLTL